jgi:cytoskeletal protein RodZ
MNKAKKSFYRQWHLLWFLLFILALLGIGFVLFVHFHDVSKQTSKSQASSASNSSYLPSTGVNNNVNKAPKNQSSSTNTPSSASSTSTTSSQVPFTVQIVNDSASNNYLHVGTLISGTSSGNCNLTASKSNQTTLQLGTSTVHQDVNSYDCGVFNISTNQFPVTGNWQLTLSVNNNGSTVSDSTSINIPSN